MPIDFRCPYCNTPYRLKDDLAGKTARCRTAECRKVMTIPGPSVVASAPAVSSTPPAKAPAVSTATSPVVATAPAATTARPPASSPGQPAANGSHPPVKPAPPKPAPPPRKPPSPSETQSLSSSITLPPPDAESLAMSALSDEAPAKPVDEPGVRNLDMTCEVCEHKWSVPSTMAGKNVLCPECQRRQRVPELKLEQTDNWRQERSNLPSLAKRTDGPLEGVQATTQIQSVSVESMVQSGAIEEDLDPLPVSYRLVKYGIPAAALVVVLGLVWSWYSQRDEKKQENLIAEAIKEFNATPQDQQLPGSGQPITKAILELASGEHELRLTSKDGKNLKDAHDHYSAALAELRLDRRPSEDRKRPDRNALLGELAIAVIQLGGTPEQVAAQTRYRWFPDTAGKRIVIKEQGQHNVLESLGRVLQLLKEDADFDFKIAIARRLTRELAARGQIEMAKSIPMLLFAPAEQYEAKAVVALEILRLDPNSPIPGQIAEELEKPIRDLNQKAKGVKPPEMKPFPSSAQALLRWRLNDTTPMNLKPQSQGAILEPILRAAVVDLLRQNAARGPDALTLVMRRENPIDSKLSGLVQMAEWSSDATPALEAAVSLSKDVKSLSPAALKSVSSHLYRLSQLAAQAGKIEEAKTLADLLPTGGYREWAQAEILRTRLAKSQEPAETSMMDLPEDRSKWTPGHAWGRLEIARLAGRQKKDKKTFGTDWPSNVIHPLALAGLALGLQDRDFSR